MRRLIILAGIAATLVAATFAGANAQQPMQRVQVGVLECRGGASIGFIVGSVTNLGCVLRVDGIPDDRYVATIRKIGVDLGITEETALAWGVYAPVARLGPGDLSGNYAGALDGARARQYCFKKCGFTALERDHQCDAPWTAGTSDVLSHCRLLMWSSALDWVGNGGCSSSVRVLARRKICRSAPLRKSPAASSP